MKTISGIEAHCAFDKEVDVEDEQLYAGVNGGRQVKAGEVLAVPPKCAVSQSCPRMHLQLVVIGPSALAQIRRCSAITSAASPAFPCPSNARLRP